VLALLRVEVLALLRVEVLALLRVEVLALLRVELRRWRVEGRETKRSRTRDASLCSTLDGAAGTTSTRHSRNSTSERRRHHLNAAQPQLDFRTP